MMIDFWDAHGLFFVFFLCFFPRLTMLFTGICFVWGGFLFWLGWLFVPRFTIAILATTVYWSTNPVLCCITWLLALSGEGAEKSTASKVSR